MKADGTGQLGFLHDLPPVSPPRFAEISSGKRLAWMECGDPEGFPVMYYHGWPSSRLQVMLAHHLALERGLRLIAMDRPGIGESTYEPGRVLATWPRLVEDFANSLGIGKFGQLGVSGGGPYALACAALIPERLTGSAVLGGAVPLAGLSQGFRGLHPAYRLLIPFRHFPAAMFTPLFRLAAVATRLRPDRPPWSWIIKTIGTEDRRLLEGSPEVWPVVTASFREGVRRGGGRGVMADAAVYFQPLGFDFQNLRHPVRYWHGGDDRNIPVAMVREFTGKISGARLEVEEPLGHFSLVLRKAAAALDYLAGCARQVDPLTPPIAREP